MTDRRTMAELLLRLLVLVGFAFTSNVEKTEQLICFEKKVEHNTLIMVKQAVNTTHHVVFTE